MLEARSTFDKENLKPVAPNGQVQAQARPEDQTISISFGPPITELAKQDPATGLRLAGAADGKTKRLIFKRGPKSTIDYRIFDSLTGHLVCVKHHFDGNPYEDFDPHRPPVRQGAAHCMVTVTLTPRQLLSQELQFLAKRQSSCWMCVRGSATLLPALVLPTAAWHDII